MKQLLIIAASLLLSSAIFCQVSISPSFGLSEGFKPTGQALVGYQYKAAIIQAGVQRTGLNFGVIGGNAGISLETHGVEIIPYGGLWYKPGARSNLDRYKDQILSTTIPKRELLPSFGIQVVKGALFVDAGWVRAPRVNVGVIFKFSKP